MRVRLAGTGAPLMGHADCGLFQHEALGAGRRRRCVVRTPRGSMSRSRARVETAQAETEPPFPLRRPVAGTLVATTPPSAATTLVRKFDRGSGRNPRHAPAARCSCPAYRTTKWPGPVLAESQRLRGDRRDRGVEALEMGQRRQVRLQPGPVPARDRIRWVSRLPWRTISAGCTEIALTDGHRRGAGEREGAITPLDRQHGDGEEALESTSRSASFRRTTTTSIGLPATGSSNFATRPSRISDAVDAWLGPRRDVDLQIHMVNTRGDLHNRGRPIPLPPTVGP